MWRERVGTLRAEPPTGPEAIALMRLVVQVQSHLAGIQTVNAFAALSDADRATLSVEMALSGIQGQAYERSPHRGGPAILVYYSPAFMRQMLQHDPVLALSALAEIYRTARMLWPLTRGEESVSKTVLIGSLTKLRPIQLTRPTANWRLLQENERTAVVVSEQYERVTDRRERLPIVFPVRKSTMELVNEMGSSEKALVVGVLSLSYLDLGSDLVLAFVNLQVDAVRGYAYASFASIAFSLVCQALWLKISLRVPWRSKEVLLGLTGFGLMLQGYRCIFGVPPQKGSKYSSAEVLAALKAFEVIVESLPHSVLQLSLLTLDMANWSRPELIISLLISVAASAILTVDAEVAFNSSEENRAWFAPYFGYLPTSGPRRLRLLCLMVCFNAMYLAMSVGSVAAAGSWALWVVLALFCMHLVLIAHANTFVTRLLFPKGEISLRSVATSSLFQCVFFLNFFACPCPTLRQPESIGGPQNASRVLMSSFGLAFTVILATLGCDPRAWYCAIDSSGCSPEALLVLRVCVPGFVLAIAALISFIRVVEPRYRWTFCESDTLQENNQRCWEAQPDDAEGDARRAKRAHHHDGHMSDLVAAWVDRRKDVWTETRPDWLTHEWWLKIPKARRGTVTKEDLQDLGLRLKELGELEC